MTYSLDYKKYHIELFSLVTIGSVTIESSYNIYAFKRKELTTRVNTRIYIK